MLSSGNLNGLSWPVLTLEREFFRRGNGVRPQMTPRFFAQLMEHGLVSPELSEAMNDFVDYGRLWKHLLRAPKGGDE